MQGIVFTKKNHSPRFLWIKFYRSTLLLKQQHLFVAVVVCVVLFLASILSVPSLSLAAEKNNVLILNSYHQGYKWTDDITRGILTALGPVRPDSRIYIEYMNTKWVHTVPYFKELSRLQLIKYAKNPIDLIICSDTDALEFLLDYRDEIFGKIPVVFCGVNYFKDEDLKGKPFYTGVSETAERRKGFLSHSLPVKK